MNIEQLTEWINAVQEWNDGLKIIAKHVDKTLEDSRSITNDDQALEMMVDLLFMRNRLESMIKVWLGENGEE